MIIFLAHTRVNDEKQCFINRNVMKQSKQNILIGVLILLLGFSIVLNWMQGNQVNRLMEEIDNMEYSQAVLSAHIEELEHMTDVKDE